MTKEPGRGRALTLRLQGSEEIGNGAAGQIIQRHEFGALLRRKDLLHQAVKLGKCCRRHVRRHGGEIGEQGSERAAALSRAAF